MNPANKQKRISIVFVFTLLIAASCTTPSEQSVELNIPSEEITPDFQSTPSPLTTKADAKTKAFQVMKIVDSTGVDFIGKRTVKYNELTSAITIYNFQEGRTYSFNFSNEPQKTVSCLTGQHYFLEDFNLSKHYDEAILQYHIEDKGSSYNMYGVTLDNPNLALEVISKKNASTVFKDSNPIDLGTELYDFITLLDINDLGFNETSQCYRFVLKDYSQLLFYPDGYNHIDEFTEEDGEWIEEKWFLFYANNLVE